MACTEVSEVYDKVEKYKKTTFTYLTHHVIFQCLLIELSTVLQVFDSTGSFLSYINTTGDPLYGPQGITVTNDGYVIAADSGNHCLKVYKYLQ